MGILDNQLSYHCAQTRVSTLASFALVCIIAGDPRAKRRARKEPGTHGSSRSRTKCHPKQPSVERTQQVAAGWLHDQPIEERIARRGARAEYHEALRWPIP